MASKKNQTGGDSRRATTAVPAVGFSLPFTTVDVVIFTVRGDALEVLLVQRPSDKNEPYPGMWALPGGFAAHALGF